MLEFSNKWVTLRPDYSNVEKIQVEPSPASGTVIYKIETSDTATKQTIEVVYNEKTKEMTVNNLAVEPATVIFPQPTPKINIDIS